MTEKVMILDAYNNFVRSYVVNPSLDPKGEPIGGTFGFLKSLQKLVVEVKPSRIFAVWDGQGGSARRKKMVKEYKEGRKPLQLNRNVPQDLTIDEEIENRRNQFEKLIDYLNQMPIAQLMLDDVEADDIIAYICRMTSLQGKIKVIISSDKDFFQLCDSETIVFRPTQNQILNEHRIVKEFNIHPNNFTIARAIEGDKSDNLPGVRGAGIKTIAKRFPFLKDSKSVILTELFEFCKNTDDNVKLYSNILQEKEKVELNYKMMQLYSPNISARNTQYIRDVVDNFQPIFNRTETDKKMIRDNFVDYNWDSLFENFRTIVSDAK